MKDAFKRYFGREWNEVLDTAEKSFDYNAFNNAYFSVREIRPVENMTLDQLLSEKGVDRPPNIIVS